MSTPFNKISSAIFFLAGVFSTAVHAQPAGCTALLDFRQDLWLSQPNGTLISRISNDATLKPAVAVHPSAALVAYSTLDPARDLVLIDASGRLVQRLELGVNEPIISLTWMSANVLRASEHRGPGYSQFHFFALDSTNRLSRIQVTDAAGSECALSPKQDELACTVADGVTLAGNDLYYATAAKATSSPLQTLNLALGTSSSINTIPPMRVGFMAQTANTVTLRALSANGRWSEQRIPTGQSMRLAVGDDEGTIVMEPVRTQDPASIKLMIQQSNIGKLGFEGNVAWDHSAKRIAVIESDGSSQRTGVLLHTQAGKAAIKGNGAVDARFRLPIDGPIVSVRFNSDTSVRFEGLTQAVEYSIPAHGKAPSTSPYAITPMLSAPSNIDATFSGVQGNAEVRGWVCK